MSLTRPNTVELDPEAFAGNLAAIRTILPPGTGIWQVCKGDGYGLGTVRAASLGAACGLDRFCAGTPEEALALRAAFPAAQVLLFPSAMAGDLPALAARGITLTIHNEDSLAAVVKDAPTARCWIKIDTGLHRFGFGAGNWGAAVAALRQGLLPGLEGIYTHFSQSSDPAHTSAALAFYDTRLAEARGATGRRLASMVAASPLLLARPGLPYDSVDPGRALYGIVQPPEGPTLRPVVRAIRSHLIDSRDLAAGEVIGYGGPGAGMATRVGAFPIGHFDGLPSGPPLGSVLIRGVRASVLARTLLASIVDLSDIPSARDGDEVTLIGRNGEVCRDLPGLAEDLGTSATLLHFGLIRTLPKTSIST